MINLIKADINSMFNEMISLTIFDKNHPLFGVYNEEQHRSRLRRSTPTMTVATVSEVKTLDEYIHTALRIGR